jgi:hypothetical protein
VAIPWLCPASTIVSAVLVVCRLEVEVVIYLFKNLRPEFASVTVDAGLRAQANRAVRPDSLVRNDLVRPTPTSPS